MTEATIFPVILCGGGGTRLWPVSRKDRPKPFLSILGETSFFQQTLERCAAGDRFGTPWIVAGSAHVDLIESQAGVPHKLIVEPSAQNTAPAIALAAALLPPDAVMLVCPSDHHIGDRQAFHAAVDRGRRLAEQNCLVTFGIAPTSPQTGFGYLKRGEPVGTEGYRVQRFVEKPDAEAARAYLADGSYSWNGGIFMFRAGVFLNELRKFRSGMVEAVEASVAQGTWTGDRFDPAGEPFACLDAESVDYAVMENTDRAAMVEVSMGWSDIGTWDAVADRRETDDHDLNLLSCSNVHVISDGMRVSAVGLSDVIIVANGNEILVCARGASQDVSKLPGARGQ